VAARSPASNVANQLRKTGAQIFSKLPLSARLAVLHAGGRYAPWEEGFDFTPPALEPGEVAGPPEFVGIGVQKAGTTWWEGLIAAHPQVSARRGLHKERHYFDRFAVKPFGSADAAQYHGWFPRRPGTVAGEWTPDYIHLPWVPGLLAQAAPEARLLVLLRDPVERLCSGLSHHQAQRGRFTAEVWADAVDRGFYDRQLAGWASWFPPDRFLVLQYERCVADPVGQLSRTFRFLDLDPFVPDGLSRRVSVSRDKLSLPEDVRRRLVDLYAADVIALAKNHPGLELDRWPNFDGAVSR
jgi:Sulfotransferase family